MNSIMKRLITYMLLAAVALSCEVQEPQYRATAENLDTFCTSLFRESIEDNIILFHKAYCIARYINAEPEVKTDPKYDIIRTSLTQVTAGIYNYEGDRYIFNPERLIDIGCFWEISGTDMDITRMSESGWRIRDKDNSTFIIVEIIEKSDECVILSIDAEGVKTEDSPYSAHFKTEDLWITIRRHSEIVIDDIEYEGIFSVDFNKDGEHFRNRVMMTSGEGMTIYGGND